ncbi:unnamed protein product [Ambrosiozyma monospora]|uniref:Unnamed protein product n=1 Tax=Ambrosiozyma monospora TaxID=43982 RepID=A0A9W6Z8D9_AMBMO|nr:unnamed protein product [Ambrosiozyma monospora]
MSETTPNNNDQNNNDTFNEDVNMDSEKSSIQPKYTRIAHKLKIHGDNLVSTVKFSPDGNINHKQMQIQPYLQTRIMTFPYCSWKEH